MRRALARAPDAGGSAALRSEMADFVLEMNDWLLGLQQWPLRDAAVGPGAPAAAGPGIPPGMARGKGKAPLFHDIQGRFHDPKRPGLGPPHASATGVYMEGLVDALRLAAELGDAQRRRAYAVALQRALRSAMALQFVDALDMFYVPVSERGRVRGGLRTTVYNNEIRVDNVQHVVMGAMGMVKAFDELGEPWGL
jgi:hypothetical protein